MRRIWIVKKDTVINAKVVTQAAANNCSEVVKGVPPVLSDALRGRKLPLVYEEPTAPATGADVDVLSEIEEIKNRLNKAGI